MGNSNEFIKFKKIKEVEDEKRLSNFLAIIIVSLQ